ncbi:hypothetical protein D3C74_346740 [compost metagenome]
MKRGISFEIPNQYGKFLGDILEPFETNKFNWHIGGEESYYIQSGTLGDPLFSEEVEAMSGELFEHIIENYEYYLIFQSVKAFPKEKRLVDVQTYKEFIDSDCQLVLLVVDTSYVTVYCKDNGMLDSLFHNAERRGYSNLEYITDENDTRTRLSVW